MKVFLLEEGYIVKDKRSHDLMLYGATTKERAVSLLKEMKISEIITIKSLFDLSLYFSSHKSAFERDDDQNELNVETNELNLVLPLSYPLLTKQTMEKIITFFTEEKKHHASFGDILLFTGDFVLSEFEHVSFDSCDLLKFDSPKLLPLVLKELKSRILEKHILRGVIFLSDNVEIDEKVKIERDVTIYGGNVLRGETTIKKCATLLENNVIEGSVIGENTRVSESWICQSQIENDCKIGPFCVVTGKSTIGEGGVVSSFSKVKSTHLEKGGKIPFGLNLEKNILQSVGGCKCQRDTESEKKLEQIVMEISQD